ncbi:hypothetical protein E2C01_064461 [Portunus trituberculatus]|uniref:Uncharacterized protein n=1 Tax=Portunus trituberculatus TaxID=210409 RepID=A0A5B7HKE4_PORTR|nr:hypothetical protein [Portunus trituberculatus]
MSGPLLLPSFPPSQHQWKLCDFSRADLAIIAIALDEERKQMERQQDRSKAGRVEEDCGHTGALTPQSFRSKYLLNVWEWTKSGARAERERHCESFH